MSATGIAIAQGVAVLTEIVQNIRAFRQNSSISLPQYSKPAMLMHRLYVSDSLAEDAITSDIISLLNSMTVSFVMTALSLNQFIDKQRTVRDVIRTVSTESYVDAVEIISNNFGALDQPIVSMEASVVKLDDKSQKLVAGRVVEFEFKVPAGDGKSTESFKIQLYIQLVPYVLPEEVMAGFMNINFMPSLKRRWAQVKAGEISFFRDFLLARDQIKAYRDALRADKSGVLTDMMSSQHNKLFNFFMGLSAEGKVNHNLASAIAVIDKRTFDSACNDAGIDFNNYASRMKFMNKTFMMMVCVVDPTYQTVDMYIHGLPIKGTYSFNQIKGGSGKEINMLELMAQFASGNAPKF